MTQEDKELLLRDLYARIPYGVIVCQVLDDGSYSGCHDVLSASDLEDLDSFRPYLRPLESMTLKEKKEKLSLFFSVVDTKGLGLIPTLSGPKAVGYIDWLNAHHFDHRGLIEKGLALEAPEDMYKININVY